MEDGGNLGNIVEVPIPKFTPTCSPPTQTNVPAGKVLARVPLSDGVFDGQIGANDVSAQVSKSANIVNDLVVNGEYYLLGSYASLDAHGSVITVKMSPPAGYKLIVTGFGIKSAAFSSAKEGFRYLVRDSPDSLGEASDYFVWDAECPDDGQMRQTYLAIPGAMTQWDTTFVSLSLMNSNTSGRWQFSDLEVYGLLPESSSPTSDVVQPTETSGADATVTDGPASTSGPAPTPAPACPTPIVPPFGFHNEWTLLINWQGVNLTSYPAKPERFAANNATFSSGLIATPAVGSDDVVVTNNGSCTLNFTLTFKLTGGV